ncbi:MAG: acetyltransferase [Eubacteriales bacterium]|nr:acetyltransferase [Eubacteriales bacterium]
MDKIIVIGGKGSGLLIGEQIYDAQLRGADVEFLGFAFDDPTYGKEINGFPLLCGSREVFSKYGQYEDVKFIFQMWRPDKIEERIGWRDWYGIPEERYATFIHPLATVVRSAKVGHGTAVMANAVINSNAIIGNHVTIQSNTLIGHDTVVGDNCFFAAHSVIGSNNTIGQGCFFGLNTSVNNYTEIGEFAFIGMASNVIKSIPAHGMVYGNPAKLVERKIKPL